MYTDTKFSNREVTSAIDLSKEQCEVKPQIFSLVGKEYGHTLHSSTTYVSIINAYSSMVLHLQDLGSQDTQVGHDPSIFLSKYINDFNRTTKISFPPLVRQSHSFYNEGQPSTIQGFNSANKWRASQAIDFFHGVPNKSQGSHLGDKLPRGPRIDPLICKSRKRVDVILEKISQSKRNGDPNEYKVIANQMGVSPSLKNIIGSRDLSLNGDCQFPNIFYSSR